MINGVLTFENQFGWYIEKDEKAEVVTLFINCKFKKDHECVKNYEGYSGGMESEGVLAMYRRSETFHSGVRYVNYLGDGDSRGFIKVSGANVYGPGVEVKKMECCGHVQKRMGARLRKLRKEKKGMKLKDGKLLSGRGRLTDGEINSLQQYYGQAIRRHAGEKNITNKKRDIWTIYFHKLSTDENPQHDLYPKGSDSWFGFQKAVATGETYSHKHMLPEAVLDVIKPIFRDLTDSQLLSKCLHGHTQNPNESFNHCIWERIPKNVFVGIETLKFGVLDAVICFNNGTGARCEVFKKLGVEPGNNCVKALQNIDKLRVIEAEKDIQYLSKEARVKVRAAKRKREDEETQKCDEYGPRMF